MADAFTLIILYGDVTSIECLGSSEDDPDMFNVFSRDVQDYKRHYSGVTWALLHLKSPAMWLFVQQFVANIKENIRAQWCRALIVPWVLVGNTVEQTADLSVIGDGMMALIWIHSNIHFVFRDVFAALYQHMSITKSTVMCVYYEGLFGDHYGYRLSLWDTMLHCNVVSHWRNSHPEWKLLLSWHFSTHLPCYIYIHRPKNVLGHLLLRRLHGNHQIWNTIFGEPNVIAWLQFAWACPITSSLRKLCCLKHNWYNIHLFIA